MFSMKKSLIIASILVLVGILVACNTTQSGPIGGVSGRGSAEGGMPVSGTQQALGEPQEMELPIESKVGVGILKLEETDLAMDKEKAEELLPLFKALKVLSTDNNTAVDEISALNTQIKNTMTAEQLAAIENLEITMKDLRTMMGTYGLTGTTGGTIANSSNTNGQREFGGGGPGGMPGGGMMGGMMSGGQTNGSVQSTPNAAAAMTTSRKTAGGYNLTFADPIIKVLQSKLAE